MTKATAKADPSAVDLELPCFVMQSGEPCVESIFIAAHIDPKFSQLCTAAYLDQYNKMNPKNKGVLRRGTVRVTLGDVVRR